MSAIQQPLNDGEVLKPSGIEFVGDVLRTSAVTLASNSVRFNRLDSSGGAFTITLPAVPYPGMTFMFSEDANSGNAVTIDGNGKNINGAATLSMATGYKQRTIRYNGTQWIVIAGLL